MGTSAPSPNEEREQVRTPLNDATEALELDTAAVFDQYRERLHRYILRLVRDAAEADDLLQETFLRAHRQLHTVTNLAALPAWLYRVATNACYDRFRQASYRHAAQGLSIEADTDEAKAPQEDADAPRLDLALEQSEMSTCVQEYIEQLSDDYRMVILLHDVHGMTNPEMAGALGCSLATVKIRLHRARAKFKEALSSACDFSVDERGVFVCDRKGRCRESPPEDPGAPSDK
jgi:RNA polymerase sigma-70 factor (ECF subfamily)